MDDSAEKTWSSTKAEEREVSIEQRKDYGNDYGGKIEWSGKQVIAILSLSVLWTGEISFSSR